MLSKLISECYRKKTRFTYIRTLVRKQFLGGLLGVFLARAGFPRVFLARAGFPRVFLGCAGFPRVFLGRA